MSDNQIIVLNMRAGCAPVIAICDVVVGDFRIHNVTVRRGRGNATHINFPRQWSDGHWTPAVTITAHDLLDQVRHEVFMAAVAAA